MRKACLCHGHRDLDLEYDLAVAIIRMVVKVVAEKAVEAVAVVVTAVMEALDRSSQIVQHWGEHMLNCC